MPWLHVEIDVDVERDVGADVRRLNEAYRRVVMGVVLRVDDNVLWANGSGISEVPTEFIGVPTEFIGVPSEFTASSPFLFPVLWLSVSKSLDGESVERGNLTSGALGASGG